MKQVKGFMPLSRYCFEKTVKPVSPVLKSSQPKALKHPADYCWAQPGVSTGSGPHPPTDVRFGMHGFHSYWQS